MRFGFGTRRRPGRASIGLGAEVDSLPGAPAWPAAAISPAAWFGQDSADRLAADSIDGTRRITLPADAMQRPAALTDWYCVFHATTGRKLTNANYEVMASNGGSISSGNTAAAIAIYDRATPTPAGMNWRWQVAINNPNGRDLLGGMTPALVTQPRVDLGGHYTVVLGVAGTLPYLGIQRLGAATPHFRAVGDDIRQFDKFYFPVAQYTNATVERAGGVLTLRRASLASAYQPGVVVLIQSVSQPAINGIYMVATRLGSNAGFTVASPGADFAITAADASVAVMRNPFNIFDTIGGLKNPVVSDNYGWGGSIGPVEMRLGTMPISDGLIDAAWLDDITHRRIAPSAMPGTLRYRSDLDPGSSFAADPGGVITAPATAVGTPQRTPGAGADWLVIEPWDWHTPFAADMNPAGGSATGTVRLRFTSAYRTGSLLAEVRDSPTYGDGTLLVAERRVSGGSRNGAGTIVMPDVPVGQGRYLHIRARKGGFTQVWGPFSVGPSLAWVSQSTINVLFQSATGTGLAPVPATSGTGTIGDVAGTVAAGLFDSGTNPTNRATWCRLARYPVGFALSAADGIKAFTNKLIELAAAEHGRAVPAAAYSLCRSGHPASIFWADRRSFTHAIGTATAGAPLIGTWQPQPLWVSAVTYAQPGTARVYRGGTYAQIGGANSEWRLTGGTLIATVDGSGNLVAVGGSGVTGTFNPDTCAFSVTDPVGGPLYIEATLFFDTPNSTTAGGRTGTGFTVWGQDNTYDTGHIDNLISRMKRQTAFVWSWANYLLGYAGGSRTQAEINAQVAFDIAMVRQRIEDNYPEHAGTPWIIACDARTKSSSSIGEHRIRLAMRDYALNTPNTYWSIGPITADMDSTLNSPHPGNLATSGQLWGTTFAHGVARALGMAGARADEVFITSATRGADGAHVDLVFNVPAGANLTCSDPARIEGLYFGTADNTATMTPVDVNGGAYSTQIIGANTVRVIPAAGSFPAVTWWNCQVGFVLTDPTFATENARLARTLSLDTGGYNGIRPGQPVSFCPANVMAS